MNRQPSVKVSGTGTTTTTGAASSAAISLPADSSGRAARFVRVVADTVASIAFGLSGVADATANDTMVTNEPTIFNVAGWTHYKVIQVTAGAKINVVALDA